MQYQITRTTNITNTTTHHYRHLQSEKKKWNNNWTPPTTIDNSLTKLTIRTPNMIESILFLFFPLKLIWIMKNDRLTSVRIFPQLVRQRCTFFFSIMIFICHCMCDRLFSIRFVSIKNRNYYEHSVPILTYTHIRASNLWILFSSSNWVCIFLLFFSCECAMEECLARKTYQTNMH